MSVDELIQLNGQIQRLLPTHATVRRKIDKAETQLIQAIEGNELPPIAAAQAEIEALEADDDVTLGRILGYQEAISALFGHPPEAHVEILELNLVLFKPPTLADPKTVGPDDPAPAGAAPPKFKRKPERIPDDQEEDPGVHLHVNNDNDDFDDLEPDELRVELLCRSAPSYKPIADIVSGSIS